ncbi:hypothetical protein FQN60_015569 [Etheostoma spectabile]|uniref:Uncharacterized protein n=1 Tax=Etheostoma spectabile TaxID=54343 RepID=A0A5J5CQC7_9PERO|nr:hypothetical protein FQN60_015569 [Etheostoma spectabile]
MLLHKKAHFNVKQSFAAHRHGLHLMFCGAASSPPPPMDNPSFYEQFMNEALSLDIVDGSQHPNLQAKADMQQWPHTEGRQDSNTGLPLCTVTTS